MAGHAFGCFHHLSNLFLVRNVGHCAGHAVTLGPHCGHGLVQAAGIYVRGHDLGAGVGKPVGGAQAHAAGCAGHQRHPVIEPEKIRGVLARHASETAPYSADFYGISVHLQQLKSMADSCQAGRPPTVETISCTERLTISRRLR